MTKKPDPRRPWMPPTVSEEDIHRKTPGYIRKSDVSALFAVSQGVADKDQQKRAIDAIHKIACTGDMSFRPNELGGDRDTIFAEGKRYVGLQVKKLIENHAVYLKD